EDDEILVVSLALLPDGVVMGDPSAASVTIVSDDVGLLPTVTTSVSESGGFGTAVVTRHGSAVGAVSIGYNTLDGSAVSGRDYTARSGRLSWPDGDMSPKTVLIPVLDDEEINGTRQLSIAFYDAIGVTTPTALVVLPMLIFDDDSKISIGDFPTRFHSESQGPLTLLVTRTGVVTGPASVNWSTANG